MSFNNSLLKKPSKDLPQLNNVLCIHHNDLDGRCAAAVIKKATGYGIRFHETTYGDPLPEMGAEENIVIVDFSYPPDMMKELIARNIPVLWFDHHATAKDYPYQHLKGLRDFEDKSRSGCEIAWDYFFAYKGRVPDVVRYIGDYDKWKLQYQPASFQYYEGLKLIPESQDPDDMYWQTLLNHNKNTSEILKQGEIAIRYRDMYCNDLCRSFGYETRLDGFDAYACNQYMFGSKGFGNRFDEYPICIAYIHNGEKFTVSLYSKDVHVGQIAKRYGGGGHKGAAGFTCQVLPFIRMT
jgi:oligoribonuclease NrnB/cAMP/cGMP phosphodiesterase (DHH superfamily)